MAPIVPDASTLAKLRELTKSVEIADENGNVIGSFVPNDAYDRIMSHILRPATREEIAAARAEILATGTLKDGVSSQQLIAGLDEIKRQWEARQ
jgi:hypothetical protein